jgi:hypothetical protein
MQKNCSLTACQDCFLANSTRLGGVEERIEVTMTRGNLKLFHASGKRGTKLDRKAMNYGSAKMRCMACERFLSALPETDLLLKGFGEVHTATQHPLAAEASQEGRAAEQQAQKRLPPVPGGARSWLRVALHERPGRNRIEFVIRS